MIIICETFSLEMNEWVPFRYKNVSNVDSIITKYSRKTSSLYFPQGSLCLRQKSLKNIPEYCVCITVNIYSTAVVWCHSCMIQLNSVLFIDMMYYVPQCTMYYDVFHIDWLMWNC